MHARVTLTAIEGPLKGQDFVFTGWTLCTVGRSEECLLCIRGDDGCRAVSRRHCLLRIDPPFVRVRDLGSLNGTYVNGRMIGRRPAGDLPEEAVPPDADGVELEDGDRLFVAGSEFLVGIHCGTDDPAGRTGGVGDPEPAALAAC